MRARTTGSRAASATWRRVARRTISTVMCVAPSSTSSMSGIGGEGRTMNFANARCRSDGRCACHAAATPLPSASSISDASDPRSSRDRRTAASCGQTRACSLFAGSSTTVALSCLGSSASRRAARARFAARSERPRAHHRPGWAPHKSRWMAHRRRRRPAGNQIRSPARPGISRATFTGGRAAASAFRSASGAVAASSPLGR